MTIRLLVTALLCAASASAGYLYVYECSAYDCVTPFQGKVHAPMPDTVPLPLDFDSSWFTGPAVLSETGNAYGHGIGHYPGGMFPYFLFWNGTQTYIFGYEMNGSVVGISDTDVLLISQNNTVRTWDPVKRNFQIVTGIDPGLNFEYYFTDAFDISADGNSMLLMAWKKPFGDPFGSVPGNFLVMLTDTPPAPIPEPGTAALVAVGVAWAWAWAWRRREEQQRQ